MTTITQPKLSERGKKLYVSFSINGNQIRKSLNLNDTKANRALARNQIIPELLLKANSGEFFKNSKIPTLDEFCTISFEMNKATRRDLTNKQYKDIYRLHIQPSFGSMTIDKIKRSDFVQWQNNLTGKLAGKTVQGIRAVFMTILQDALKDEVIEKNYLSLVNPPKVVPVIKVNPFTVEEMYKILDNAPEKIVAYFAIGFFTGMRTGEIIALKWDEIDFDNKLIKVRHSIRSGQYTEPKTKSSIRDIEILDVLMPYLIRHKKLVGENAIFVFETYNGDSFKTSDKISSHYWKKVLEAVGVEYRNLYQMRHTFASQMLSNNEDVLWVSKMLGHKDSSITLKTYAKHIPNKDIQRASFLDRK